MANAVETELVQLQHLLHRQPQFRRSLHRCLVQSTIGQLLLLDQTPILTTDTKLMLAMPIKL